MRSVRNIRVYTAAGFVALMLPSSVRAEDGGLPQFDTSLFPEQLFWLAITFVVLYLLMAFVALPRVTQTKQGRRQFISSEIDKARIASDEAKLATEQVEKLLKAARDAAHTSARDMMVEVGELTASRQAAQDKELLQRLQGAEAAIAGARDAALTTVRGSATELAAVIVEKVLCSKPIASKLGGAA